MTFPLPPLTARLAALADLIPPGSIVADVGAGHGHLALRLVADGRASRVIVIERSPAELAAAVRLSPGDPRAGRIDYRRGDGLEPALAADGVDVAVIAGMGRRAIVRILDRRPTDLAIRRFVLQTQSEAPELRASLHDRGFTFEDERLVLERGRWRAVLAVELGGTPADVPGLSLDDALAAGPCLLRAKPPALYAFWERELARHARHSRPETEDQDLARARRIVAFLGAECGTNICAR